MYPSFNVEISKNDLLTHGDNIKNLSRILKCFHISSGINVNFLKSRLFGTSILDQEIRRMANVLGCVKSFPFSYLGVSVVANVALKKHWELIIDNF